MNGEPTTPKPLRQGLRAPLATKLLGAMVGLLFGLSLGASFLFLVEAKEAARLSLIAQGDAIASTLNYSIEILLDKSDLPSIQRVVSNSALLPNVRQVLVVDRDGKVISSSDRLDMDAFTTSRPLLAFLASGDLRPEIFELDNGDALILRPLRRGRYESINDTGVIGAIQITIDRRAIEADAEIGALRMLGIHLGSYALLVALLGMALRTIVARPLLRLADAAGRMRTGDRSVRSAIRSGDEIGLVSEAFDRMAEEVEHTVGTLEEKVRERTVALQKENEEKSAALLTVRRTQLETEQIKGDLISVVSHELRTPLTAIRGALGLLAGGVLGPLPAEQKDLVVIAERNTLRLIELVNDILDLDRLQRGLVALHIERVSAARLIERSVEAISGLATEQRVRIEVQSTAGELRGDERRLVQVLVNLLSNAIKFSPAGSAVTIRSSEVDGAVEVSVTDEGPGIPVAHQDRIFDRFHQVEGPSTRSRGGTGLGLSISKALIDQHRGSIGVQSTEGKGSTFWFRVPAFEEKDTG